MDVGFFGFEDFGLGPFRPLVLSYCPGKAWAYVQIDDALFLRRAVTTERETPEGWFVDEGFAPGDHLVITGAQMLLSEEFRWQIQGDDDD